MKITITGPRSVGKSTVSKIIAEKLNLKYISSDEIGNEALKEKGGLSKAIKSGEIKQWIKEKGYNLILDVYNKRDNFVFDLSGGSVSSRSAPEASKEVREIAKSDSFIVGLLPSGNEKESVTFLFEREKEREHFKNDDRDELLKETEKDFKKYPPLFEKFCNLVIYTKEKSSEEIADEIISKVKQ